MAELDQTVKEMKTDPARVYITGFSSGAFALYPIVSTYPDRFAAAVPISGTICLVCGTGGAAQQDSVYTATLTPMRNVPIWIFNGAADATVPVADARLIVQILTSLHAPVKYTEYPNAPHTIWDQVYASPDLYTWLFAQHR
jgi:predicted peptidase